MTADTNRSYSTPYVVAAGLSPEMAREFEQRMSLVEIFQTQTVNDTLRALAAGNCSLLVLNHVLNGLPALDVLARVRANASLAHLPVLYLLDRHLDSQIGRQLLAQWGVQIILVHPVNTEVVAQKAAEMIGLRAINDEVVASDALLPPNEASASSGKEVATPAQTVRELSIPTSESVLVPEEIVKVLEQVEFTPRQADVDRALVLLVGDDHQAAERIAIEAVTRGIRVDRAEDSRAAEAMLDRERPDVVLLDLGSPNTVDAGLALLHALGERLPDVPVLVLTASDTFLDRVQAASLGSQGYLPKSLPPAEILDAVMRQLQQLHAAESRIMVVDDDPAMLAQIQRLLEPQGIQLTMLADPLRFWDTLEQAAPDLLILGVHMPRWSGTELCRVVRNDVRWNVLPVLFLTEHADAETIQSVFAAGADDYISRPSIELELIPKVLARLERTLFYRGMAETDPMTGVANRLKSTQTLRQFLRLAERHNQPLSLALLDVDFFKQINDQYGHGTGDAVLQQLGKILLNTFRSEDVVARWGGEEFLVGMYGMNRIDGVQRLADLLESLRHESLSGPRGESIRLTFSGGVAQFPEDGADVQSLYRAADAALYRAKESGRNRVLPVGWDAEPSGYSSRTADIVLVNDDEVLGSMIVHALESQGYRTQWIKDGEVAALQLGGFDPSLSAPVLLLDVDLPSLDGLGVLRRLARDRSLHHTRVIMMASRMRNTEVARALEIGAFDQIPKPFHLPVLLQRVRRALEIL